MVKKTFQLILLAGLIVFNTNSLMFRIIGFDATVYSMIKVISAGSIIVGILYYIYYFSFNERFPNFHM